MAVCEHCKSRHTWDCDDGLPYPKGGCDNFILDVETLTKSQQEAIKSVLMYEEKINNG